MAVAAYASVVSLLHVLDRIQHPSIMGRLLLNTKQIETLHEKLLFLQEFLELHSQGERNQIPDLARQIAEVANEAQGIIDSHVTDQLHGGSENKTDIMVSSFCQDIDKVSKKFDPIRKELLTMVKEEKVVPEQRPGITVPTGPSTLPSGGNNTIVGFDEHLLGIMDELIGNQPKLQIIPIVGMGGIGKTTLARLAFENKCVVEHFHLRAWFTVSQEYSVREILLGLLRGIGASGDYGEDLFELGKQLYQNLSGRTYLIVIDDMWSIKVWNDLRMFFPDNINKSRIIMTTRLSDMAACLGSRNPYLMDFLDDDKSWNLFREKAFAQGICSPELKGVGKKIAKSCRGLPLAIVVIGRFLAKSNMTLEYWDFIAENVSLYANSENDEQCLKILALSYHHLPIHLKPCFLYMRVFPEDCEVQVSQLIKLWIAEGFLKPLRGKNLEDVATEYLKDLIHRNLIVIRKQGLTGRIKTCGIHDLLRDLCMKESHKEHFFGVPKVLHFNSGIMKKSMCLLCSDELIQEKINLRESHSWLAIITWQFLGVQCL